MLEKILRKLSLPINKMVALNSTQPASDNGVGTAGCRV